MKDLKSKLFYPIIIVFAIVFMILIGMVMNKTNMIEKQETKKSQLTATSENAYITTEEHLKEIEEIQTAANTKVPEIIQFITTVHYGGGAAIGAGPYTAPRDGIIIAFFADLSPGSGSGTCTVTKNGTTINPTSVRNCNEGASYGKDYYYYFTVKKGDVVTGYGKSVTINDKYTGAASFMVFI